MPGGGSVDTSMIQGQVDQANRYAGEAAQMGQQNFQTGQGLFSQFEQPTLTALLNLVGLGQGGGYQYTDPLLNQLMQPSLQTGQQAAGAAQRSLRSSGLGPVATMTGQQQIDLTRMGNAQTAALTQVQTAIQQLLQGGQQGTNMMTQAPSALTGAGQVALGGGQLENQIAQLQYQAQRQNNMGLLTGLQGIGQIAGMFGGMGAFGQFGAFGAGAGAAGGGASAIEATGSTLPLMMAMF